MWLIFLRLMKKQISLSPLDAATARQFRDAPATLAEDQFFNS
jgi:hypothetical protein